jgi:hypothetical protein
VHVAVVTNSTVVLYLYSIVDRLTTNFGASFYVMDFTTIKNYNQKTVLSMDTSARLSASVAPCNWIDVCDYNLINTNVQRLLYAEYVE